MNQEEEKISRRSPRELVYAIMEELPVHTMVSVHEIAGKIGSNWGTVQEYLDLIKWIQKQPRVECVRTGVRRYGWRRARKEREARKT